MAIPYTSGSFELYRPQATMEMPGELVYAFENKFPEHKLQIVGSTALYLLRHHESKPYFDYQATRTSVEDVKWRVLEHGNLSTAKGLNVKRKRLQYHQPGDDGLREIALFVEDESGILEAERTQFLNTLRRATGVDIPPPIFIPRIKLGIAPKKPDMDAFEFLKRFVPDKIHLDKVEIDPPLPKVYWDPRCAP